VCIDTHCQIPGILSANSVVILNAHTQLRLASLVRGLAHRDRKHWHPARQSLLTGGFLLEGFYHWSNVRLININKLVSGEEQRISI
jgi:hypothetical protein